MRISSLFVASSLFLSACGGVESQDLALSEDALVGVADVYFNRNWQVTQVGALVEGGQLQLNYDAERLPRCRGDFMGNPGWSITAYYRTGSGPIESTVIAGHNPNGSTVANGVATIDLLDSGDLEVWFQATSRFGCMEWDSNFGRNFRFTVTAPPSATIAFDTAFDETLTGGISRNGAVRINYELDRLPTCRQTYNGLPTWDIVAYWRFDNGRDGQAPVTSVAGARVPRTIDIAVPPHAQDFEIWFKASDRAGCVAWDSNFGKNYHYSVN